MVPRVTNRHFSFGPVTETFTLENSEKAGNIENIERI